MVIPISGTIHCSTAYAPAERTRFSDGMAERVGAWGGALTAGPTGSGTFEVRASIPTGGPQ